MQVKELLEQQRSAGFPAFEGSDVTVRLPLRETVINELLQAAVFKRGPKGPLTGASIRFHGDNRFTIHAAVDKWPLPKNIAIDGAFAPTTDFRKDPRLLILLAPSGLIGMVLKIALNLLDSSSPLFALSGNNLFLDLPRILAKAGAADFVPLLQTLKIRSELGALTLELNLHVNAKENL